MTKRYWSIIGVGVVVTGLLLSSLASARPGHGHFGRGGPGFFPWKVLKNVDLTETQQATIETIKEAHREKRTELKTKLKETRKGVMNLLLGESDITKSDFTTLQAELNQLRAALFEESLAMGLAIRAELTPAQRAQAATLIEEFRARRAEKRAEWRAKKNKER